MVKRPRSRKPKNDNYLRMLEYGEWLEKALDPALQCWQVKELFEQGIGLIDLHYEFPAQHPVWDFCKDHAAEVRPTSSDMLSFILNEARSINEKGDALSTGLLSLFNRKGEKEKVVAVYRTMAYLDVFIRTIRFFFRGIASRDFPWYKDWSGVAPDEKFFNRSTIGFLLSTKDSIADELSEQSSRELCRLLELDFSRDWLLKAYNRVVPRVEIIDNEVHRRNVIIEPQEGEDTPADGGVPFHIILTRIALDFLFMGGQEYFSFCKGCDKFIVSQRKGRRQWCEDRCRLRQFHKNRKQS